MIFFQIQEFAQVIGRALGCGNWLDSKFEGVQIIHENSFKNNPKPLQILEVTMFVNRLSKVLFWILGISSYFKILYINELNDMRI